MTEPGSEHSDELSEPLETRAFRPVETSLPGDWATDGQTSIQITSERDTDRRRTYVARVYDSPADSIKLSRVRLLAESQSNDHVQATRLALEGAEEEDGLRADGSGEPRSEEVTSPCQRGVSILKSGAFNLVAIASMTTVLGASVGLIFVAADHVTGGVLLSAEYYREPRTIAIRSAIALLVSVPIAVMCFAHTLAGDRDE